MAIGQAGTGADEHDPGRWGHSLANLGELLLACLDAAGARSVAEVGAYAGDLTRLLLEWAARTDARIVAIDPSPHPELLSSADRHPELELVPETSHEALGHIALPDAIILDGDHNYYTVSEELRLIGERAPEAGMPLLIFHDVAWPHGRRDSYWSPERVPEEHRQPLAKNPVLFPGNPGIADEGLRFMQTTAAHEGGPRNGVLTALEDFLGDRPDLRLATVSAFFGFGAVWHRDAPWAGAVAAVLGPWDGNAVVERLEANRLHHLATSQTRMVRLERAEAALAAREAELERLRVRIRSQERDEPEGGSAADGERA